MIYLCATPIGNLGDLTLRALETLQNADLIACEDTRRTLGLLAHYGIKKPVTAFHAHNWRSAAPELLRRASGGDTIVVVSDAGTPGISDPGAELARAAIDADVEITLLPGACSPIMALVLSGLPCERFAFEGFLPREKKPRRQRLEELAGEARTFVLFESPRRVRATLAELYKALGDRPAAMAREMTKLHEQVLRSTLSELCASITEDPPGEIVLVIGGAPPAMARPIQPGEVESAMAKAMADGHTRREAARIVARALGIPGSQAYQASLTEEEA